MMPERRRPSGLGRRYPGLLIALGVDPVAYYESNGYIIGEQGKPPDFVLEVASASTADEDTGPKRLDYEALGISEYWRFDETGDYHKTKLAGDRLVDGHYETIAIEELDDGVLQGYTRRPHGSRGPGRHILTYDDQRARAENAQSLALRTRPARRLSNRPTREARAAKIAGGEPPRQNLDAGLPADRLGTAEGWGLRQYAADAHTAAAGHAGRVTQRDAGVCGVLSLPAARQAGGVRYS